MINAQEASIFPLTSFTDAKYGAKFMVFTITGGVVPPRVPQPVPEVQVGRTSIRPIPEVAACAP